jgi:hypothetical protein
MEDTRLRGVPVNKVVVTTLGAVGAVFAAVGMGFYVYPQRPWLVWALLLFCWLCYRLKRRAEALYGARRQRKADAENVVEDASGRFSSAPDQSAA